MNNRNILDKSSIDFFLPAASCFPSISRKMKVVAKCETSKRLRADRCQLFGGQWSDHGGWVTFEGAEEVPDRISLSTGLLSALISVFRVLTKAKHYRQVSRCAAAPDNKLRLADTRPLVGCTVGRHRVASQLWDVGLSEENII